MQRCRAFVRGVLAVTLTLVVASAGFGCTQRNKAQPDPAKLLAAAGDSTRDASFAFFTTGTDPQSDRWRARGRGELSGDDHKASWTAIPPFSRVRGSREQRLVGGALYIQNPGPGSKLPWRLQSPVVSPVLFYAHVDPRGHLGLLKEATGARVVGEGAVEGVPVVRVKFDLPPAAVGSLIYGPELWSQVSTEAAEADIGGAQGEAWISTDDGAVRRLAVTWEVRGEKVLDSVYRFTRVGEPVSIEAPSNVVTVPAAP